MASTATLTFIRESRRGQVRVRDYVVNVTTAEADGVTITPSTVGLSRIYEAYQMANETGGVFAQYVMTTPGDAKASGSGAIDLFNSSGAVTSGDQGEFRFRFEGV